MKPKPAIYAVLAGGLWAFALSAEARITSLEIVSVQSPTCGGLSFGEVGQHARGMVEYSADVHILEPIEYIAFATTNAERFASHDPRLSLEERYGTQRGYVCAVKTAAAKAVKKRHLLQEEADAVIAEAAARNLLPASTSDRRANAIADRLCKARDEDEDDDDD